ncbi:PAS domain-containing sensor histidine kinase [Salegentibacter sp. JZCK2]|uniref:sensor histidine kinase n=1 Tax=Salegentibacter tibetensis TaxID=2873600 RepID=UPI001CD01F49|nr:PAS domain-containing sensor histidine kinase [Salegentibacter tibetensis]MBZ9730044.1 PAS domain-containing sensor histidine kinase [Salegentibacter tibetensis]
MSEIFPGNNMSSLSLEQLVKEFRFVIDLMPQMVWATQPDGYHDFYNQRWFDFTGLSYEETKDKGWSLVLHPDDYERTWEVWQKSLETGAIYEIEYRMRKFDGTYIWFLARAQPLKDESGKIIKWFGTCTDIQEQREILEELEQTKKELHISNKDLNNSNKELSRINLELDNFVYSASHDLKAPLNNIEGLVALLEPSEEIEPNQDEVLPLIGKSVKRFKEVVNDMTLIAQTAKDNNSIPNIDFQVLLSEIQSDLSHLINSTGSLINLELEIKYMQYPRKEIRSILFNLISNGIKYGHPNRPPLINVRTKLTPEEILIEVEDNGSGIEAEYLPELFDKYFRIKSNVEGSGLGLFIVKRMVEHRGGRIEVKSKVGKGSVFSVFLKPRK